MSDEPKKRESQRALDAEREAERQRLVDEAKARAQMAVGSLLSDYLEEDTAVHRLRELATDEQREQAARLKPTPTPVTQPVRDPARLADTRQEPSFHPTIPSPPPKMTPPTGGIPAVLEPSPPSGDKILVVDDDGDTVTVLSEILRNEGFAVLCASDGVDALKHLFHMPRCDLILLDIRLPRLSGADLAEVLLASPWAHVPVVLISAGRPDDIAPELREHYAFLGKPVSFELLIATVRSAIHRAREIWGEPKARPV